MLMHPLQKIRTIELDGKTVKLQIVGESSYSAYGSWLTGAI